MQVVSFGSNKGRVVTAGECITTSFTSAAPKQVSALPRGVVSGTVYCCFLFISDRISRVYYGGYISD